MLRDEMKSHAEQLQKLNEQVTKSRSILNSTAVRTAIGVTLAVGLVGAAVPLLLPSVSSALTMATVSMVAPLVAPSFVLFGVAALMYWLNPEMMKRLVKFVVRHWRYFSILLLLLLLAYIAFTMYSSMHGWFEH